MSGVIPPPSGQVSRSASQRGARRPGMKQYSPATIDDESGQSLEATADWLIRDGEFAAIATADQRVLFRWCADELTVVCPLPLDEFELPVKMRSNKGE